ncbi:hypothetical protein OSB04_021681 [Centaurea solstitialis]|uniref:Uncharacterized protein n=1 Tax=Centaurea solstitialis TaxID=347529 RepID=A0AA38T2D2_9ASTR|nr:hypothetical protein OSB04_021681 [Centaurea solstitialis]
MSSLENKPSFSLTTPHHDHILDRLQKSFHPTANIESHPTRPSTPTHNHSALELYKAGVKFKPNKNRNWPLAIDFHSSCLESFFWCCRNRTLRIPVMSIDDNSETFLRNVIAYEQCTPNVPNYVTSYVCAIDYLVNTPEDLSRLIESKIVTNDLGSNEEATKMINKLAKEVVFCEFYYKDQWENLDGYYNRCWPNNIAWLKRNYFNSPWNAIALFAGIIVFALTIIETIYSVKAK